MLAFKTASQLTWGELQFIENPISAKRTVESNNGSSVNGQPIHYAKDDIQKKLDDD